MPRHTTGRNPSGPCATVYLVLCHPLRGWRGQVPRQPGQVRKEAATTSPTWVDVQPLTYRENAFAFLRGAIERKQRFCGIVQ
jgi:hypothetical protein